MRVGVLTMVVVVIVTGTAEASDPGAIINLKTHIGNYLVNKASAVLQAKQNLILSGTHAVLAAKQNLIQKQLPHLVAFKIEKLNSLLQLKKNLLSTTAAQLGQIHISSGGGKDSEELSDIQAVPSVGQLPPLAPPAVLLPLTVTSYETPPAAPDTSYGPPPGALPTSYETPSAAPGPPGLSFRPPSPTVPETPGLSFRPPPPAAPASSYGPPPAEPVRPTTYVKPVSSVANPSLSAPPSTCGVCSQSSTSPVTFSPYRPGAHVQPAPPPRPHGTYRPPTRLQVAFGPPSPSQLPQSYEPLNHKPANTYGPPPAQH